MNIKVVYQIGKESSPMDAPPFDVFIYWLSNGQLLKAECFSESELVREIERLRKDTSDTTPSLPVLEEALLILRKSNSTRGK